MARHRDIRNMDYEDEYDGYDDVYGHSVDDDYYISPSNRQFIYNRESSRDSRFEHTEDNIEEADEIDELTDTDKAKLLSCIDQINDNLGHTAIPRNDLIDLIMKFNFNTELVLNAILEDPKYNKLGTLQKGKENRQYLGKTCSTPNVALKWPKNVKSIGSSIQNNTQNNGFIIPKLFLQNSSESNNRTSFNIPNIFTSKEEKTINNKLIIPKLDRTHQYNNVLNSQPNEYSSLSDLVNNHLKNILPNNIEKNKDNSLSKKFKEMRLDDSKQINYLNGNTEKYSQVDLSNALNMSNSLPNVKKTHTNKPEKFEIPFIDCEIRNDNVLTPEIEILPCKLDTRELNIIKDNNYKKASKFGSVMCSTYKHPKLIIKSRKNNKRVINIFTFDTMSPDDYIIFHLKK